MLNVNSPQRVGNPYAFLDRNRTRDMVFYGRVPTEHEAQLSALENQMQWYEDQAKYHPNWDVLDKYIEAEHDKEKQLQRLFETGSIDEQEKFVRGKIIAERIAIYERMSGDTVLRKPFYYLVVYDRDKSVIREILTNGISSLMDAGMSSRVLDNKGLAVFLKYTFTDNFEENDVDMLADLIIQLGLLSHAQRQRGGEWVCMGDLGERGKIVQRHRGLGGQGAFGGGQQHVVELVQQLAA